jgi:hypothetical protein
VYGDGTVNPSNNAGQSGPASLTITAA